MLSWQEPEKKKMFFAPIAGIHYREAKLTQGREWFISFYVIDPVSGKLKRVRIKCNRERNARLRKKNAMQMVAGINQRLSMGWNPLSESVAPNASEPLLKCIDGFLKIKKKETEAASYRCYESFVKIFRKFLDTPTAATPACGSGVMTSLAYTTGPFSVPHCPARSSRTTEGLILYGARFSRNHRTAPG